MAKKQLILSVANELCHLAREFAVRDLYVQDLNRGHGFFSVQRVSELGRGRLTSFGSAVRRRAAIG
jgi:hypothetical protein